MNTILVETIGWISTLAFLLSILMPLRRHRHQLGVFSAVTPGYYAYEQALISGSS